EGTAMPEDPLLDPPRTSDPAAPTDEPLAAADRAGGVGSPAGVSNPAARYRLGEQGAGEEGFSGLSWFGDHFQIASVGIAVDPARIPRDYPALQALMRANQRALLTIAEQPQRRVSNGRLRSGYEPTGGARIHRPARLERGARARAIRRRLVAV